MDIRWQVLKILIHSVSNKISKIWCINSVCLSAQLMRPSRSLARSLTWPARVGWRCPTLVLSLASCPSWGFTKYPTKQDKKHTMSSKMSNEQEKILVHSSKGRHLWDCAEPIRHYLTIIFFFTVQRRTRQNLCIPPSVPTGWSAGWPNNFRLLHNCPGPVTVA